MIKAVPFIYTAGSKRFNELLSTSFSIDMLYPIFNDKSCITLFEGWKGKNMLNWYKFSNDDKIELEFYPDSYRIIKIGSTVTYNMKLPISVHDFINDMNRFSIDLYWTNWIDENFEPKEYLHKDEIHTYFKDLLNKMGKSHELH